MAYGGLATMFEKSLKRPMVTCGDPIDAWDAYVDYLDRSYKAEIKDRTCFDCVNCRICDIEGHESIGWCLIDREFVEESRSVEAYGCQVFENITFDD